MCKKYGGSSGDRTLGPLIKSELQGVVQVIETWAIPTPAQRQYTSATRLSLPSVVSIPTPLSVFLPPI
jgi:hypothetical protein